MPFFFSAARKPRTVWLAHPVTLFICVTEIPFRRSIARTTCSVVPLRGLRGAPRSRGIRAGFDVSRARSCSIALGSAPLLAAPGHPTHTVLLQRKRRGKLGP